MPDLTLIRGRLRDHAPLEIGDDEAANRAAVAMVLHDAPAGPSVLFIERARREGDPWSGHMAFPGGRMDATDATPQAAAERETFEEVGLSLEGAELIGRLDDKRGNPRAHPTLVISAFVYRVADDRAPALTPNYEVASAFWFPVAQLLAREHQAIYAAHELEFPGIRVGEERHVVWGLTYSFLESFFDTIGRPLEDRWQPEMRRYQRSLDD